MFLAQRHAVKATVEFEEHDNPTPSSIEMYIGVDQRSYLGKRLFHLLHLFQFILHRQSNDSSPTWPAR